MMVISHSIYHLLDDNPQVCTGALVSSISYFCIGQRQEGGFQNYIDEALVYTRECCEVLQEQKCVALNLEWIEKRTT